MTVDMTPKHLRVGINSALVESAALAGLLISRGVITEEEYFETIADAMEAEKRRYEQMLTYIFKVDVTLV